MSELKATPGEWEPRHDELVAANGNTVAVFVCCGSQEVNSANAHLIAAAPELYDALHQSVTSMQDKGYPNNHIAVRAARAALAKARGEI